MSTCKKCGRELSHDEVAIYKKLVSRGAEEFLCIDCLSQYFKCDRALILKRIDELKKMGCTLFSQAD